MEGPETKNMGLEEDIEIKLALKITLVNSSLQESPIQLKINSFPH